MKIGKLLGLILAVLFFSMIQVQAETWSAGPALIPGEKSKFYESTELRFRTSVAKIPVYKGKNTVFQERFNEKMRKEGNHYLLALHGEKIKRNVAGWLHWQEGSRGKWNSIILVESVMYEGAAHPINYVKGITLDDTGREITLEELQKRMPRLTVEKLQEETEKQCRKKGIVLFDNYKITEFPGEFYIGTNHHLYFIFQQYDIGPYSSGWIMVDMGKAA